MPLIKRGIEPVNVSRAIVPSHVRDELEFVSNATLYNIIRQLSSLSRHAEDVFGELHRETCCVLYRSGQLDERIDRLKQKILELNPTVEEVSLQDINMRKPFKSSVSKDQQIISLASRSQAISEKYADSEPPPALHKLDAYREDGKQSLKFYTDPGYFFDLWCHEMTVDAETNMKKQKHRNKRVRSNKEVRAIREPRSHVDEYREKRHGPEFVRSQANRDTEDQHSGSSLRPGSLEIQKLSHTAQAFLTGHGSRASEYGYIFSNGPLVASQNQRYSKEIQSGCDPGAGNQLSGSVYQEADRLIREGSESLNEPRSPGSVAERPRVSPPAPPGGHDSPGGAAASGQGSGSRRAETTVNRSASTMAPRETLPPPPPTPTSATSLGLTHVSHSGASSTRHRPADLPSPPTPPPLAPSSPNGWGREQQLPSPPPPPLMKDSLRESESSSLPTPPPLLHTVGGGPGQWSTEGLGGDKEAGDFDVSSEASNAPTQDRPMVRDTRSDLLSAIREGLQLRKVEERRLKTEQKQQTSGRLDVQSIMEAAFEMRRKALESNDSDKDDDEEGTWSDEG